MRDRTWGWHGTVRVRAATSLVFFGFLVCCTVRLAIGEWIVREDRSDSVRAAAAAFGNARYFERWAELEPERSRDALHAAVSLNPRAGQDWLALALAEESAGDLKEAARDLTQANLVDHRYLPAWTAANFYFRHGDAPRFWSSAARAATLCYDDLRPLIDLADRVEPKPLAAIARLGDTPHLERAYLDDLIGKNRWGDAQAVALRMLARHDDEDVRRLTAYVDRLISAGRGPEALLIWSGLRRKSGVPPAHDLLTNGDLETPPSGLGFDWRVAVPPSIAVEWQPSRLRLSLEGTEPDPCVLLEQRVVLAARCNYKLRFEYQTQAMPAPTGLAWALLPPESAGAVSPDLAASESWRQGEWNFEAPRAGLAYLRLVYRRAPGTIRAQGRVELRHLRLEAL